MASVPQRDKYVKAASAKTNKQSRQSKVPDRKVERVKVSESRTLAGRVGARKGKRGLHSEGGKFQIGERVQARRASLGEVKGSMSG